jgi:hypothetical protein
VAESITLLPVDTELSLDAKLLPDAVATVCTETLSAFVSVTPLTSVHTEPFHVCFWNKAVTVKLPGEYGVYEDV